MDALKRIFGWFVAFMFFVWAGVRLALDFVGRSTFKEDLEQLMSEQLPEWQSWLFSTPWWAPTVLGAFLVVFLFVLNWPKSNEPLSEQDVEAADLANGDEVQFDITFKKHVAPNQDGLMIDGGHRICAGFEIEGSDFTSANDFQIVVQVSDENGWRLYEEDWLDGTLPKGRLKDHYPLEICKSDDDEIVYTGGHQEQPRVLQYGKFLTFHLEIYVQKKLTVETQFYLSHTPPGLRFEFDSIEPDFS